MEFLFVAWIILCILLHIPSLRKWRRLMTLGGLVPNWYLFTADFLTKDVGLQAYRVSGERKEWQDVAIAQRRSLAHVCWNPGRRIAKAVFDSCDSIVQARLTGRRDQIAHSIPFRLLAQFARNNMGEPPAVLRFAVVFRTRHQNDVRRDIVFLSPDVPPVIPRTQK